jgi:hypothetical protein
MTTFFTLAATVLAADEAFLFAGACGAAAAFTHPTGVLVGVPLALAAGAGLTLLCLVTVFALLQAKVGRWDAFLR